MHKVAVAVGAVLFSHSLAFAQTPAPTAADFAAAMDVPAADLLSAEFDAASNSLSRRVTDAYGTALVPRHGVTLVTLSTGRALDASDPGFVSPEPGTNWNVVSPNPYIDAGVFVTANGNVCGDVGDSPPTVNDLTELRLTLRVPPGATALAFDFNFITAEYPEWLCNPTLLDRFVALLEAGGQTTNIAVDSAGRSISSNSIQYLVGAAPSPETGFPPLLGAAELVGTGMDTVPAHAGGTSWITTTAPVTAGQIITLRFLMFEHGDSINDSVTLIDNFRWLSPGVVVTPSAVAFGNVGVGQQADVVVTVQNPTTSPIQIGQVGSGDGLSAPYSFAADTCSLQSIDPSRSCDVTVRFQPTQADTFIESFNIPSSDPGNPNIAVQVVGRGIHIAGVGGTATQLTVKTVHCVARRSAVTITLDGTSNTWDCQKSGLKVNPGDTVIMTITGQVP